MMHRGPLEYDGCIAIERLFMAYVFQGRAARFAVFAGICVLIGGCARAPLYKLPDTANERALLKVAFEEQSILAGVMKVSRIDGEIQCGEPIPNPQTLMVVSRGNPLISDINAQGAWIAAGERFSFSVIAMMDGWPACGWNASFAPRNGATYELRLLYRNTVSSANARSCSIEVADVTPATTRAAGAVAQDVGFRFEPCRPKVATK